MPPDAAGEGKKLIEMIKLLNQAYFVVWAPEHYTLLKIILEKGVHRVEYRDSLAFPAAGNLKCAKQILINLGFETLVGQVVPQNKAFQMDAWSCGLWSLKFLEQDLRAERREPPVPVRIEIIAKNINIFIQKLKAKAAVWVKAPPPAAPPAAPAPKEPVIKWATLEEAIDAGQKCAKCHPTKYGTKGCTSCMGHFFEEIRVQKLPKATLKDILKK